jgi:hypothetical protein
LAGYNWESVYTNPEQGATEEQISAAEARLDVRFPEALRQGLKAVKYASIFKREKRCAWGVAEQLERGEQFWGFMQYLEPIDRIEFHAEDIADYVNEQYERPFPDVIPFALLGAGGWTCLNYQNDPTRANPEVWEGDMETNAIFEEFFHKVADSFDDFIEMLLPDDEIEALGFRV